MKQKRAFSFVEIIIVISIITLLAVIGLSYQGASNQKAQNTKAVGDIGTINNSILSYLEEEKNLPTPEGNKNFFGIGSEYSHDETTAFGVHGFVTENLLSKKYINYLPLDPRTNQYYAYGKTLNNKFYEVAGVVNVDGDYQSIVKGNYPGETGPYSLIREYNGPDFVTDKSQYSFPYNPTEKILVAKINDYSGTITISNGNYIITGNQVLEHTLVQGDTITVSAGGSATLFYSDGSQSTLGDTSSESKLTLANMEFKEDDNLLTRIKVALDSGTLWTKATNLNSKGSDFEVYTQDTAASVRGTIFGIKANSASTQVTVTEGKVEIKEIPQKYRNNISTFIKDELNSNLEIKETLTEGKSYNGKLTQPTKEPFSANINFDIEKINIDNNNKTIEITISLDNINNSINKLAIVTNTGIYLTDVEDPSQEALTLTGSSQFHKISDGFSETKKQRNSLYLKDVELETTDKNLSEILENSENKIYLCNLTNTKLSCSGKQSFETTENQLQYDKEDEEKNKIILDCKFKEDYKCLDDEEIDGMKLFAYAPYNSSEKMEYLSGATLKTLTHTMSGFTIKGGYLDASGTGNFLAYSGSELNLGSDFVIEMSVKGSNLMRNDRNTYNLIDSDSGLYMKINNNNNNTCTGLNENDFYKIIAINKSITSTSNLNIKVLNNNGEDKTNNCSFGSGATNSLNTLYIGNRYNKNNYNSPWNGIINYVKIYK